jgi:hypothetical protein
MKKLKSITTITTQLDNPDNKSIRKVTYNKLGLEVEIKQRFDSIDSITTLVYDEKNNLIEEISKDDDETTYRTVSEYENNKLIKSYMYEFGECYQYIEYTEIREVKYEKTYDMDKVLIHTAISEFKNEKLIKHEFRGLNNELEFGTMYQYADSGNLEKQCIYMEEDSINETQLFTYNEQGNISLHQKLDEKNKLIDETVYVYSDELLVKEVYKSHVSKEFRELFIKYNENELAEREIVKDKNGENTLSVVRKYDENGNPTLIESATYSIFDVYLNEMEYLDEPVFETIEFFNSYFEN